MQINEQLKLPINGVLQYVSIRAEEAGLPLLLYLHGGPGDAALPLVLKYNRELESHFTVAVWEQRGAGKSYYDFGDSIRFGANPAAEDEQDLSKVYCDLNLFEEYTKGFLEECGDMLTAREIELLPFAAKIMTFECGIRFLTDHIAGDTYFKIHREGHNLDRCRTQFKLVADMEAKMEQMKAIVAKYAPAGK